MGYTHYWYRDAELPTAPFRKIVDDFKRLLPELTKAGIRLAGGLGEGEPEIGEEKIWFNGLEKCGHARRSFGIAWPSDTAGGVAVDKDTCRGGWFGGALLENRACGGDCSHETFDLPRVFDKSGYVAADEKGRFFNCTKTAYKPYDVAVTAALLIAKKYLGDKIRVTSDGEDRDWFDAKRLCQEVLGYGLEFKLELELKEAMEAV